MDIDMPTLRLLEREREISLDVLVPAIEQALLSAYHRTPGAQHAGPRRGGPQDRARHRVGARADPPASPDEEGAAVRPDGPEFDDTPDGFGRIATATARQVIVQRLRDAEDDQVLGDVPRQGGRGRSAGVIQQGRDPRTVLVDVGGTEAVLPAHEQVPGEKYVHGDRLRGYVLEVARGHAGPADHAVPHAPEPRAQAVRAGGARDRRRHRRDHRDRARGRPPHQDGRPLDVAGVNAKGACIGPMGGRVRAVMAELHGEKIDIVDHSDDPAEFVAHALSPARVLSVDGRRRRGARRAGGRARLPAVARHRQGGPERPPRRQAHRLAHRHPLRRRGPPSGDARCAPRTRHASDVTVTRRRPRRGRLAAAGPRCPAPRVEPPDPTTPSRPGMGPVRTCVGCRATGPRSALLRVVATRERRVRARRSSSTSGRRHAGPGCLAAPRPCVSRARRAPPGVRAGPAVAGQLGRERGASATSRQACGTQDVRPGQVPASDEDATRRQGKRVGSRWLPDEHADEYPAMSTQH